MRGEEMKVPVMDINRERLDAVYALCRKYAKEIGINSPLPL